jgi:hypothetical protein
VPQGAATRLRQLAAQNRFPVNGLSELPQLPQLPQLRREEFLRIFLSSYEQRS